MNRLVGIYGAGGAGRGIMPLARAMKALAGAELVFIDDGVAGQQQREINGHAALTFDDFLARPHPVKSAALAIADAQTRLALAERCATNSIPLQDIWASQVIVMDDVVVEEGAIVSPYVVFTSNIRVGRCFHANLASYVEHDCRIGDFVTFAPGVRCNGNVTIGDHAYIGSGAILRQGLTIGKGATVGMGAVVTKDVAPGTVVVGNPARVMSKG